jgi:hypothetical protein
MPYYKITSLTTKLPKRHLHKDSKLEIEYREGFDTKINELPAGGTVYISTPSLPVNYHKLRMKELISVVEIGKNTFMKLQHGSKRKAPPVVETITTTKKPVKKTRKKAESTLVVKE